MKVKDNNWKSVKIKENKLKSLELIENPLKFKKNGNR